MKIDVFISYEHNSKSIADAIVASFEKDKIRCWYAPRDVIGDYATSIVEAIENAAVFVLILNGESSNSPHVLNEVEMAYKKSIDNSQEVTIVPFKVANAEFSRAMEYYIKRIHWIDATTSSLEAAIGDLKTRVKKILGINEAEAPAPTVIERTENKYYYTDEKEIKRLRTQMNILKKFDGSVYEGIAGSYSSLKILDLGCSCGDNLYSRFGSLPNLNKAIGLEYDSEAVNKANATYGSDKFKFYECDIEGEDFADNLEAICSKEGIEKFDVISMSMLILHLKKPYTVLKTVRKFLAYGGSLIIKDIDDGFSLAYPDKDNIFSETVQICSESDFSGYRSSGREIYTMLKGTGFSDIRLENLGLSTVGTSYEERAAMFEIYFNFVLEDAKQMSLKYPSVEKYAKHYKWMKENYDRLESEFMRDDFFYVYGFMLFTAKK